MFKSVSPTFRIDLQLFLDDTKVTEFDAAIWEPVDCDSPAILELTCATEFEHAFFMSPGPFEIQGTLGSRTIRAKGVWIQSFEQEHHPDRKHSRPRVHLDAVSELEFAVKLENDVAGEPDLPEVEYFLTNCKPMRPAVMVERHPDGQVIRKLIHRHEFKHPVLGAMAFDTRHGLVESSPGILAQTTTLSLKLLEHGSTALSPEEMDSLIRDALCIAGFAARYPIRIWCRQTASKTAYVRTYFQALSSWSPPWPERQDDSLVSKSDVSEFLTAAIARFNALTSREKDSLRQAMLAARSRHGTLEDQFRAAFSAFEGVCNALDSEKAKQPSAAERAQRRRRAKALAAALETVRGTEPLFDVDGALRRLEQPATSPSRRFRAVSTKYGWDVSDLWPAYRDGSPGLDLYAIRNLLAHGVSLTEAEIEAVHFALESLKLILERVLLSVLGWNVGKSKASPEFVRRHTAMHRVLQVKATLRPAPVEVDGEPKTEA